MFTKALGAGVVLLSITIGFLWHKNGQLHEEIGELRHSVDQAAAANEKLVVNFDSVNGRLMSCIDQVAVDKEENAVTVANLEARYARLEIRSREAEIRREEIFRDPSCADLRDLDMHAICPDWANELRFRATTLGGDGDTRSTGSDPRTPP